MNLIEENKTEDYTQFDSPMPPAPSSANPPAEINPDVPHWNASGAFGIWLASVAVLFVLGAFAVAGYVAFKGAPSQNSDLMKDPTAIIVNIAAIIPAHLLTIFIVWAFVTRLGKQPFLQTLGWTWNKKFGFWACAATTVGLFLVGALIVQLFGEQENELIRILQSSRTAVYLTAILATFTAPFAEEAVYRGVLYPGFKKWIGTGGAIAIVTFLFALVHVPQYLPSYGTILVICLLSLALTSIRAWTQSLLPCFVIHTMFNGVQAIALIAEPFVKTNLPQPDPKPALFSILTLFFN